ncbi:MAG: RnfABCDGE type electron transport complex subunit D [Bacillota bacterium]
MEIVTKNAPHLRRPNARVVRMMRDVSIALTPLVIFAIYQNGLNAFLILLVAVLSMVGTEYVYYQIVDALDRKKHEDPTESLKKLDDLKYQKKRNKEKMNSEKDAFSEEDYKAFLAEYKDEAKRLKKAAKQEAREFAPSDNRYFSLNNKSFTVYNFSVITSGLIYGLTMPDQSPLLIVAIAGVVGVFLAKLIFGGMGQNIFNIAAFARVFVVLSFGSALAYESFVDAQAGATALGIFSNNMFDPSVTDTYSYWTMFSGIGLPGSLGETSALLILTGGLYLAMRRSFDFFIPLTYIGTVFLLATAVMFQQDLGFWYPLTHILSGGLMFGAVYMATDPISIPVTRPGRIYFAFGLGVVTFVIRLFGSLPEGVVFAILIMNMFVPAIDYSKWSHTRFNFKRCAIFTVVVALAVAAVLGGTYYA